MRLQLGRPPLTGCTGRGIRIAVVDSGVHVGHPHIGSVSGGIHVGAIAEDDDYVDRIGHGTAVCAAIHEKAPNAELFAIKIFDRRLTAGGDVLARAIRYAANRGARLVNLSLGTTNAERLDDLRLAVRSATEAGAVVVAAREHDGIQWLPGLLPDVVGVSLDWSMPRHELEIIQQQATTTFRASGYPRPIPGVPHHRNLSGISFAVANVTGILALLIESDPSVRTVADVSRLIDDHATARS